ncbi:MAG: ferric reductase-like transmembrane domain-containing protein [Chlamydiales bacterium]
MKKNETKKGYYLYQSPYVTNCCVIALVAFILGAWIWAAKHSWGIEPISKGIGSGVGILGYTLLAFSLFLSSRWKKLEDWIGGLDRVYHLHHKVGLWGFYLLLAHPWINAMKWLPQRLDHFFLFIFPFHHRVSVNLGSYAFWLMLIIIVITIFKLLPYDKWKLTHKFMALVFVLASLHFLLSSRRFNPSFLSLTPLFIPMCLGLFGIGYKQIWMPFFFHYSKYVVTDAQKINDNTMMVTLKPKERPLNFIPGQYAFFSFRENLSKEQHPFTTCHFQNSSIFILAKVRGDFTRSLYEKLCKGTSVLLEGPYGRFDYRCCIENQIWLAGGIGIVPFLAWSQSFEKWPGKVDLFYCVHREVDVLFLNELQSLQKKKPLFNLHIYCTENKQRLTIENIVGVVSDLNKRDIFMCGPKRLTSHFLREFQNKGIKRANIHFEDFEFF